MENAPTTPQGSAGVVDLAEEEDAVPAPQQCADQDQGAAVIGTVDETARLPEVLSVQPDDMAHSGLALPVEPEAGVADWLDGEPVFLEPTVLAAAESQADPGVASTPAMANVAEPDGGAAGPMSREPPPPAAPAAVAHSSERAEQPSIAASVVETVAAAPQEQPSTAVPAFESVAPVSAGVESVAPPSPTVPGVAALEPRGAPQHEGRPLTSAPSTAGAPERRKQPKSGATGSLAQSSDEDDEAEGGDPESLEDELRLASAALRTMRSDYDARVRRSRELRSALTALQEAPKYTGEELAASGQRLREQPQALERLRMRGEDRLAGGHRLFEEQRQRMQLLEERARALQNKMERLRSAPAADAEDPVGEVLRERQRQASALRCDTETQRGKIARLAGDLRGVLDFMMRVNIEAKGGPAARLGKEDFLPRRVRESLRLSQHGQACVADLFQKYKACMAGYGDGGAADQGDSSDGGSSGSRATAEVAKRAPETQPPLEEPTESFNEEAKLLRRNCTSEMRVVASTLSEDASNVPQRQWTQRELLCAAAWGDKQTLEEFMPVVVRSVAEGESGSDDALLGWTAWHAAAAHGQATSVAVLHKGEQRRPAPGLEQRTACGFVPLSIASLQGHVEAVRALLVAGASVDARDTRGNTPLLCAAAGAKVEQAKTIIQALLKAQADPAASNRSGQRADLPSLLPGVLSTLGACATGPDAAEEEHEPYYCVRAAGSRKADQGFFAKTVGRLKSPARDAIGFMRKADSKLLSRLGEDEAQLGVWSSWVTNYTHAGLLVLLEDFNPENAPTHPTRSQQAVVLTSERLLLLDGPTWTLLEAFALPDVVEVVVCPCCDTVLLLRLQRWPDLLLDLPERERFLEELQLALSQARWPGAECRGAAADEALVATAREPILPLLDGQRSRVGTLAFVEPDAFLLLPFAPSSLLLSRAAPTLVFGFLDLQRRTQPRAAGAGVCWRWQRYFFMLKDGKGEERRLVWCHHPNAARGVDSLPVASISQVRTVNATGGDHCLVLERVAQGPMPPLTLRARSLQSREEWASAIRALQGKW